MACEQQAKYFMNIHNGKSFISRSALADIKEREGDQNIEVWEHNVKEQAIMMLKKNLGRWVGVLCASKMRAAMCLICNTVLANGAGISSAVNKKMQWAFMQEKKKLETTFMEKMIMTLDESSFSWNTCIICWQYITFPPSVTPSLREFQQKANVYFSLRFVA